MKHQRVGLSLDALLAPARSAAEVVSVARSALEADAALMWARRQSSLHTQYVDLGDVKRKKPLRVDLAIGEGLAGVSAEKRIPFVLEDLSDASELKQFGVPQVAHGDVVNEFGWRSAIYLPIVIENRLLGVLAAYSVHASHFNEYDIPVMTIFSERLSARVKVADVNTRFERMVRIGTAAMTRAHDLREEAGSIQTNVDALKKRVTGGLGPEETVKRLDQIKDMARRSQDMAEQTLRQVVSERAKPRLTPMRPIVDAVVRGRLVHAQEYRIHLTGRCEQGLAVTTWEREIGRALSNLVDNAIYFVRESAGPGPPRVEVTAAMLRSSDGTPSKACVIQVKDNGPGIAAEERPRVFDFGYSGKRGRGLGIGLSYVESVVEACGGQIEISSDNEFSTIFSITLSGSVRP